MHPLLQALFSAWEWRLDITLVLVLFATFYTTGWWRLRHRSNNLKLANKKRLAAYWSGLVILAIALMSPVDTLGSQLFFMHMIQHLFFMMIGVPLLLLADPFPFLLWGLPPYWRRAVGTLFTRRSPLRRLLTNVTQPSFVWIFYIIALTGWHDPNLYSMAQRNSWIHDVEHLTFFVAAMLFSWHVVGSGPKLHHPPLWGRIAMLIGLVPVNAAIGVVIATSSEILYPYYASIPHIWGFTALEDQALAGVIMWIPGSMMYLLGVIVLLARALRTNEDDPPQPVPGWDDDAVMVAPGLEHRVIQNKWRRLKEQQLHSTDVV